MSALRAFTGTARVHIRNTIVRPMFQVVVVVQPIVTATVAWYVYRGADVADAATFTVLGSGLAGTWSAITFSSAGDINRERFYGTLEPSFAVPTPVWLLSSARAAAAMILSVSALLVGVAYSMVVLRVDFTFPSSPSFWLGLVLFYLGTNTFALTLANVFLLSRRTRIRQNFLEWPLLLVTGILFPIAAVPMWAQVIGSILPMRWAAEAIQLTVRGEASAPELWLALLTTIGFYGLALLLFPVIERRVRWTATLDLA